MTNLKNLAYIRMSGKAPTLVWVIAGDRPRMPIEGPDIVHIGPNEDVYRLDLRPLVGLHVDVFENGNHPDEFFESVSDAIDRAKPKSTGLAKSYQRVSGINDEHELLLRRVWERLCS